MGNWTIRAGWEGRKVQGGKMCLGGNGGHSFHPCGVCEKAPVIWQWAVGMTAIRGGRQNQPLLPSTILSA